MIIPVSSNILTISYIISFEILLQVAFSYLVSSIFVTLNNHWLAKPHGLLLCRSRLDKLVNFGLSARKVSRTFSLLGIISFILTVIGSFSINGKSSPNFVVATAPVMTALTKASSPYLDYSKHVSPDATRVSATFLLASQSMLCGSHTSFDVEMFSVMNNYSDLLSVSHSPETPSNSTCISQEFGYQNAVLYKSSQYPFDIDLSSCNFSVAVMMKPNTHEIVNGSVFNCEAEFVSAVTANYYRIFLIMQIKTSLGYLFVFRDGGLYPNYAPIRHFMGIPHLKDTPYDDQVLLSTAYIYAVGTLVSPIDAFWIAQTEVRRNGRVLKIDGQKRESVVNEKMFMATAGMALGLFITTGLLRIGICFQFREGEGNGLCSAADCMKEARKLLREGDEGDVWIGFRQNDLSVGPVGAKDVQEGLNGAWRLIDEGKVDGRYI